MSSAPESFKNADARGATLIALQLSVDLTYQRQNRSDLIYLSVDESPSPPIMRAKPPESLSHVDGKTPSRGSLAAGVGVHKADVISRIIAQKYLFINANTDAIDETLEVALL